MIWQNNHAVFTFTHTLITLTIIKDMLITFMGIYNYPYNHIVMDNFYFNDKS